MDWKPSFTSLIASPDDARLLRHASLVTQPRVRCEQMKGCRQRCGHVSGTRAVEPRPQSAGCWLAGARMGRSVAESGARRETLAKRWRWVYHPHP